jgi:hypothetical protein
VSGQRALDVEGSGNAGPGGGEHGEKGIPLGVDLPAAVPLERSPDQTVMIGQQLCVGAVTELAE